MKERGFDPDRLDVAAFASQAAQLQGRWPLSRLDRLASCSAPDAPVGDAAEIAWRVWGEQRKLRSGASQTWLHLTAHAAMALECQRCLRPVLVPLNVERSFLFVAGEQAAEQTDADIEEDVLALTRAFNLPRLVEDELLLALPLVPRHDVCPVPLVAAESQDAPDGNARPNPFAVLRGLKGSKQGDPH